MNRSAGITVYFRRGPSLTVIIYIQTVTHTIHYQIHRQKTHTTIALESFVSILSCETMAEIAVLNVRNNGLTG